jgi:hypothetical protein
MTIETLSAELQSIVRGLAFVDGFSFQAEQLHSRANAIKAEAEELGYFFSSYDCRVATHEYDEASKAQIRNRNG